MAGLPPRYAESALEKSSGSGFTIRSDQFHARPVATIVREYLEMRKRADIGPATLDEIFDALAQGGYESHAKDEQTARISLNNALTKNPVFYKLPNKRWGLLAWYPKAKQRDNSEDETTEETGKSQPVVNVPTIPSPSAPPPRKIVTIPVPVRPPKTEAPNSK